MRDGRCKMRWMIGVGLALIILTLPIETWFSTPNGPVVLSASELIFKPGTVLVRFEDQVGQQAIDAVLNDVKAARIGSVYGSDVLILKVAEGREEEIISRLAEQSEVLYAELDYLYSMTALPDDPYYGAQWAHSKLHSSQAWDITTGSTTIHIAIVDSGIDDSHPDLAGKILAGQSFLNQGQQDANPVDLNGHGTHVAGIATAVTDNNAGIAGMSWGARIIPVRVLDNKGDGWTTDIASGINWARTHGADIINLSLGGELQSATMQTAIQEAYNAGILVVAAMGNLNQSTAFYPAAYPHVLAVAATTRDNIRAPYSNYGTHNDIAAPGGYMTYYHDSNGILSTMPTYAVYLTTEESYSILYDSMHGTSQAAPFISGLAALIWTVDGTLSPDEVANIITSTATDLGDPGWDPYYGHGMADAKAALDSINQPDSAPVLNGITNADQDGDYTVRWSVVDRATNYRLEVSSDSGFGATTLVYSGPNQEYQVIGQSGGTWYYRVRASNISGDGPWSNTVYTSVLPDAPTLLPILSGSEPDAYTLSWSAVIGARGYVLQQAIDAVFTQPVTAYQGADLLHHITGQSSGVWFYRVRAYNNIGAGAWSNVRSKTVPTATLQAPDLLPIGNADGDATYVVQWTAVPSATLYTLEESGSAYFHTSVEVYSGILTAYTVTHQAEGTWYYRVRGHRAGMSSPWSSIQKAIVISRIYNPLILKQYTAPLPTSYLSNGDFEAGGAGWEQYSYQGYPLIVDRTYPGTKEPHGGDWEAWMGGVYSETAYLQQKVLIYESAPYLTFWHWIETLESACGVDNVRVIVNTEIVDSYNLCFDTSTGGWVQHSVDLHAYTGGEANLKLRVVTNGTLNSNYFLDDIAFSAVPVTTLMRDRSDVDPTSLISMKNGSTPDIDPSD